MAIILRKNKRGTSYTVRLYLPKELQNTYKRERIQETFKTQRDAEKWERKKTKEMASGFLVFAEGKNIEEVGFELLELKSHNENGWSPATIASYEGFINNYYVPVFGKKLLSKYTTADFIRYEKYLDNYVSRLNKKLTEKSKYNISTGLRSILKYAKKKNYIDENVLNDIPTYGQKSARPRDYLKANQIKPLLNCIEDDAARNVITFLAFTGLRISEVCGLRFSDVDFESAILTVNHQIYHTKSSKKGYILRKPKCDYVSSINLNAIALKILEEMRDKNEEKDDNNNDFVFTNYAGKPYRRDSVIARQLKKAVEKAKKMNIIDKEKVITQHSLRHSYGSLLAYCHESINTVQSLLRHQNFHVTYDTYVHLYPDSKPVSFKKIEGDYGDLVHSDAKNES